MFKKLLLVLLLVVLVSSAFSIPNPSIVWAEGVPTTVKEQLATGQSRINKYTVTTYEGMYGNNHNYSATVSSLPSTLNDLSTKIICEWLDYRSPSTGEFGFKTGNNLYSAKVIKNAISVDYNSAQAIWDPIIYVDSIEIPRITGPTVVPDPVNKINLGYRSNTIRWTYEKKIGGWWIIGGHTIKITRYLRQIEGILLEYYILASDPQGDLAIDQRYVEEDNFDYELPVVAWDSNNSNLLVGSGPGGLKFISEEVLASASYPVTIDPTINDVTSWGTMLKSDTVYSTASTASTADTFSYSSFSTINAGNDYSGGEYDIWKAALYFPTTGVGSDWQITSAYLSLMCSDTGYVDTDFRPIIWMSAGATYPRIPLIAADYQQSLYGAYDYASGSNPNNWASLGSTTWLTYNRKSLWLNSAGISNLNYYKVYANFKFMLGGTGGGYDTTNSRILQFYSVYGGSGTEPQLVYTYVIPVSQPQITTRAVASENIYETLVTFDSQLTSDGGEPCSVSFNYGLTTSMTSSTTPAESGVVTGEYVDKQQTGLFRGALYYYQAKAVNGGGTGLGTTLNVLTKPSRPLFLDASIVEGNQQVYLIWSKGTVTGTTTLYTRIMRREGTYPTGPYDTSATQVTLSTGTAYTDTGLTNGVNYYYRIWSYAVNGSNTQDSTTYDELIATPYTTSAPSVYTYDATPVGDTTATLRGYLEDTGGYTTVTVEFQYGKTVGYELGTVGTDTQGVGTFNHSLIGLDVATLYYYRAVATNVLPGTDYGDQIMFITGGVVLPTVTTDAATNVGYSTVTLNGTLDTDGSELCEMQFEYGFTVGYGNGTTPWVGGFSALDTHLVELTGLNNNTTYHFRVNARNGGTTVNGLDASFLTLNVPPVAPTITTAAATSVGFTTATVNSSLSNDGGEACEVRFQYGLTATYATGNTSWIPGYSSPSTPLLPLTGLVENTTYHFQAQARNQAGNNTGGDLTFTTAGTATEPYGTTEAALPIGRTSATFNMHLDDDGGEDCIVYFEWGIPGAFNNTTIPQYNKTSPDLSITDSSATLASSTNYEYRGVIINGWGDKRLNEVAFTTNSSDPYAPNMISNAATGILLDQATINGLVLDDGLAGASGSVTAWFEWGEVVNGNYTASTGTATGFITGSTPFSTITSLDHSTYYHFRIVGQNTEGFTGYGNETFFTTQSPSIPAVVTAAASPIGATTATLQGQLDGDGGWPCEVKFQFGLTSANTTYTSETGVLTGYTGTQSFSIPISSLVVGSEYNFRALASNDNWLTQAVGDNLTFVTQFTAPEDFTAKALSSTSITLRWTSIGDETVVYYLQGRAPINRIEGIFTYRGSTSSCTVNGLQPGTPYFFSAWSWRDFPEDPWSIGYSTTGATTLMEIVGGDPDMPGDAMVENKSPTAPSQWWQDPSGDNLATWPVYGIVEWVSSEMPMPSGSLWAILSCILVMLIGGVTWLMTGEAIVVLSIMCFAIGACALVGTLPLFLALSFVIPATALAWTFKPS